MRTRRSWRNQERLWQHLGGKPAKGRVAPVPFRHPAHTDPFEATEGSKYRAPAEQTQEERAIVELALGRIFRMGSRATQPGDVAEYERCRAIIMRVAQRD